jgi:2-methylcitrate dehydratase
MTSPSSSGVWGSRPVDDVLNSLVDLVQGSRFENLSDSAVSRVVRHTVDSVGCGAGGFGSGPATTARSVARGSTGSMLASMYGEREKVLVDHVGFANATANRFLDFNDFGVSGHPSDMIPAVLAMAESAGASGSAAVLGIHLAYEVATALAEAVPPDGGWDQGIYCSLGIAAAQAKLLGLDRASTGHALSLAAVPSIPLRVTRFGELSEWKAAATGQAAMAATFAVRLAQAGMSGPPEPFTGEDGLLERVWPTFDLDLTTRDPSAIERASLKRHPACYWGQVPVDLVTDVRSRVGLDAVSAIEVETCEAAWRTIGGGRGDAAEKWRPTTRETADHSMPYLMAVAWLDGRLGELAFEPERLHDPSVLSVIDRITVRERADLTARATRDTCPTELVVHLADGSTMRSAADVPRGHHTNPMTDAEVSAKFDELARHALDEPQARELADRLWAVAHAESLVEIGRIFRAFRVHDPHRS